MLTVTAAAIITGLMGNFIAASRLLHTMAEDDMLPKWFGVLNEHHVPRNALLFLMRLSLPVPLLGGTAIGWIVDVNTIGATIAYGHTSAAAFVDARKEGNRRIQATGVTGFVMAVLFFFYFMAWSAGAMSTESYLILAGWSILGFVYSRVIFLRDTERRFGKSTVAWIALLFPIFFTTLMWVKQATREVLENLGAYNVAELAEHGVEMDETEQADAEYYLARQMGLVNQSLGHNTCIQLLMVLVALSIMLSICTAMSKRERERAARRVLAEESRRARSTFLSNMSHDIRAPMNAIIGYINLAERKENDLETVRGYLKKIKASSHHLLALINAEPAEQRVQVHAAGRRDLRHAPADRRRGGRLRQL